MWFRPSPAVCCTMLYDLMIWPFCSSSSSFWVVVGWISQGHIPRSLLLQDWETNEPVEMKLQRMTEFQHLRWFLAFRGISKLSQGWYSSSIWLRWLLFKRSSHGSLHCRMMTADCSKNLEIENRSSSSQCMSLYGFQTSLFICDFLAVNFSCNRFRIMRFQAWSWIAKLEAD